MADCSLRSASWSAMRSTSARWSSTGSALTVD
jgi:hypothetical protein